MKYVLMRRAIVIALLFVIIPITLADESQVESTGNAPQNLIKRIPGSAGNSTSGSGAAEPSGVAIQHSDTDENKEKLTIFFAIGLVVNIVMMSLFGWWAIRQWRKSDKRGQAVK